MNRYHKYYLSVMLLIISNTGFSAILLNESSYWQCFTFDNSQKQWWSKREYKKVALNSAYESCKKESQMPATCKASAANCEGFHLGVSLKPLWRCTVLDLNAIAWKSNFYPQRDDAALGAKAFCKENSGVPETCYINMVTCRNFNQSVSP